MVPKITVLVAVYNAEKYLRDCLDSLVGQTLKEIQVVCVDDASTDHSWSILQEYATLDKRIEIIHLDKNGGQANARNIALKLAKGLYTCFLDSDDWLSPDALEQAVLKFEEDPEYDSVLFHCKYSWTDAGIWRMEDYPMKAFRYLIGKEAFVASLNWKIHGIYAVKTAIHLRFPYDETCHSYSDDNTTRLHYISSRKVATCEGIYYYRQHSSSVTHQVSAHRFDYLKANASMKRQLMELQVEPKYLRLYENHRWLNLISLCQFAIHNQFLLSKIDNEVAKKCLLETWESIETDALEPRNHYKLGYVPFHSALLPHTWCWRLFSIEQRLYYLLRKWSGRMPKD